MIINDLDLDKDNPAREPRGGQLLGNFVLFGQREVVYASGGKAVTITGETTISAPFAIGGAAAGSAQAALYLAQQLEELRSNPDLNPVYVQFRSGGGVIVPSEDDGWYVIEDLAVNKWGAGWKTFFPTQMSLRKVNPAGSRRVGMATIGGALKSTYSATPRNWVAYPLNTSQLGDGKDRAGGEGIVRLSDNISYNPQPILLSATVADGFKGGCRVYDVMAAIATNPVPTNGTFVHANWVEVKGPDHRFIGDIVLTNGFFLLVFSVGVAGPTVYHWNTVLGTPAWFNVGTLPYEDNSFNASAVQQISVARVGLEEVSASAIHYTSAGGVICLQTYRLQRGERAVLIDVTPKLTAQTNGFQIVWNTPAAAKIAYSAAGVKDTIETNNSVPPTTDLPYGAAFIVNSAYPFIGGFLYQNAPFGQPYVTGAATQIALGDNTGPAKDETRHYGFFALPFLNPQNLQGEGENGTVVAGVWTTVVDAAASNGNTKKMANAGAAGQLNVVNNLITIPTGGLWARAFVRVRVTSTASGTAQFRVAVFDNTGAADVTSVTYAPAGLNTGYIWVPADAAPVLYTAAHVLTLYVQTTGAAVTDYFVDEMVLLPVAQPGDLSGPQDIALRFLYDRMAKLVRG